MKPRITITDIAKRAGVHYTTVSMALRNHPRLPLATRERLRALAQEMGYRPDPMLHALINYRTQRTTQSRMTTLACVTNGVTRASWRQDRHCAAMLDGAANRALELGYQLEHFWLSEPGLTHRRLSEVLHSRGIVGVLIAPQRHETDRSLLFDWSKFSVVGIDCSTHQPSLHNVAVDRSAAVRVAMRRVRAAGYRRIGFAMHYGWDLETNLAWSSTFFAEQQRISPFDRVPLFSFGDACALHGPAIPPNHLSPDDGFDAWLRRFRPDVLISSGELVNPRLDSIGISIPRDLAFADILAEHSDGKVAGIRHNHRRVGEVAVEILTHQMHQHTFGVPEVPTTTLVEGAWMEGESLPMPLAGGGLSETPTTATGTDYAAPNCAAS